MKKREKGKILYNRNLEIYKKHIKILQNFCSKICEIHDIKKYRRTTYRKFPALFAFEIKILKK